MILKEQVNANYIKAFKSKNTIEKNLLSVVKGEIQTVEKNTGVGNLSDEDVIKILNKTAKSLSETITALGSENSESLANVKLELDIIRGYLPKEMSREEVTNVINELLSKNITNIGAIMKEFSTVQVDKKMVSDVIKELMKK